MLRLFGRYLQSHCQAIAWARRYIGQSPVSSTLLVGVLGLSFALPLSIWVIAMNVEQLTQHWQRDNQLSVYLSSSAKLPPTALLATLRDRQEVEYANYVSPDQGLQILEQQSGLLTVSQLLSENPLPAVIEIHPIKALSSGQLDALMTDIRTLTGVSSVHFDQQWLTRILSINAFVHQVALGMMVAFCLAMLLIVGYTIRLVLAERESEIQVLRLVGATSAFIRRPFLYFGFGLGALGAFTSICMIYIMIIWLQGRVNLLASAYLSAMQLISPDWLQLCQLVFGGALMGAVGAWLAIPNRFSEKTALETSAKKRIRGSCWVTNMP